MCASCDVVRDHCQAAVNEGKAHSLATAVLYLLANLFKKAIDEVLEDLPFLPPSTADQLGTGYAFDALMRGQLVVGHRIMAREGEEAQNGTVGAAHGNFALATMIAEATLRAPDEDPVDFIEREFVDRIRRMRDDPTDTMLDNAKQMLAEIKVANAALGDDEPQIIASPDEVEKLLRSLGLSDEDGPVH